MTHTRLIKRNEMTPQAKPAHNQAATVPPRATVTEWLKQYQATKPRNARAAFAALFVEPQLG